jgi:23S rRNA (adenine2030-N6)-methyltransferase
MNYRHAYHAGNFADVFKHVLLARILTYLNLKDAPYYYLDTHAGIGLYDLDCDEAQRTGESFEGFGKLATTKLPPALQELFEAYLQVVDKVKQRGESLYPGSPSIAQHLMRSQDRLAFCELHKDDVRELQRNCGYDERSKVLELDGFKGLKAYIPPKERRGMVLIDPPFENTSEFEYIIKGVANAHKKWATGIYAIWYPIKGLAKVTGFIEKLKATQIPKILRLELLIDDPHDASILSGCGFAIINPPWTLKADAEQILPFLAQLMGREGKGSWRSQWVNA